MYLNYINDRKSMGYECLTDTRCGDQLVLITDSTALLIRNITLNVITLNVKRKSKRIVVVIILVFTLCFSNVQPAQPIGLSRLPAPVVRVHPSYQHDF